MARMPRPTRSSHVLPMTASRSRPAGAGSGVSRPEASSSGPSAPRGRSAVGSAGRDAAPRPSGSPRRSSVGSAVGSVGGASSASGSSSDDASVAAVSKSFPAPPVRNAAGMFGLRARVDGSALGAAGSGGVRAAGSADVPAAVSGGVPSAGARVPLRFGLWGLSSIRVPSQGGDLLLEALHGRRELRDPVERVQQPDGNREQNEHEDPDDLHIRRSRRVDCVAVMLGRRGRGATLDRSSVRCRHCAGHLPTPTFAR